MSRFSTLEHQSNARDHISKKGRNLLIWNNLTPPWQGCIEEAWAAYCMGSLPIGAVVTDTQGRILGRGRNRIHESWDRDTGHLLSGHRLAHAEDNALLQIEWHTTNPRTCILYTTTEPCPLCIGAIRMALIGELRYASRDGSAGSIALLEMTPFLHKGNVKVIGPPSKDLEIILTAMLVEFALAYAGRHAIPRYEQLISTTSVGTQFGQKLFASKQLHKWRNEGRPASFVLNQLAESTSS